MLLLSSKAKALVLDCKRWFSLPGWVERPIFRQRNFKYLGVFFTTGGRMECDIVRESPVT